MNRDVKEVVGVLMHVLDGAKYRFPSIHAGFESLTPCLIATQQDDKRLLKRKPSRTRGDSKMKRLSVGLASIASLELMAGQTMAQPQAVPQPNCDIVQIAKTYVETHFPFIDIASDRRVVVTSAVGAHWQVTFDFNEPARYLGFVPEITVDPRTCQVVAAKVWQ